jgi:hypothetical protein
MLVLDLPSTISHSFFLLSGAALIGGMRHVMINDRHIGTIRCRFTPYYAEDVQDASTLLLQVIGMDTMEYGAFTL